MRLFCYVETRLWRVCPVTVHNGDRIEAPVQRLCQLESTVQMLKATVTRLQADLDLSRKDIAAAKDKEKAAKAVEQELQRTRAERTQLSSQCDQLEMQKRALEDQLANLQLLSTVVSCVLSRSPLIPCQLLYLHPGYLPY